MVSEKLIAHNEGAVLFAEIAAPPMNLPGPELWFTIWSPSFSKRKLRKVYTACRK